MIYNVPPIAAVGSSLHPVWRSYSAYWPQSVTGVRCAIASNEVGNDGPESLDTALVDAFLEDWTQTDLDCLFAFDPILSINSGSAAYVANGGAWQVWKRPPSSLNSLMCDQQQAIYEYVHSQLSASERTRVIWAIGHEFGEGEANGSGLVALDISALQGKIATSADYTSWNTTYLSSAYPNLQGAHEILQAVHEQVVPVIHTDYRIITAGIGAETTGSQANGFATLQPAGFDYWELVRDREILAGRAPTRMSSCYYGVDNSYGLALGVPRNIVTKARTIRDSMTALDWEVWLVEWTVRQNYITGAYSRREDEQRVGELILLSADALTRAGFVHCLFSFMGWDTETDPYTMLKSDSTLRGRALASLRKGGYTLNTAIGGGAIEFSTGETITESNTSNE